MHGTRYRCGLGRNTQKGSGSCPIVWPSPYTGQPLKEYKGTIAPSSPPTRRLSDQLHGQGYAPPERELRLLIVLPRARADHGEK